MAFECRTGETPLVTRVASSIGAEVVTSLSKMGWNIAGLDLREPKRDLALTAGVSEQEAACDAASRTDLVSLAKTLGRELLVPENILVDTVAPGIIDTPQLGVDAPDAGVSVRETKDRYAGSAPAGRIGHPEGFAAAVAWLVSEVSTAFVGQLFRPDGGIIRC